MKTPHLLILLSPLVVGGIIAVLDAARISDAIEKYESWIARRQSRITSASGRFSRFVLNPLLWVLVKLNNSTSPVKHRGLKNGIRVTATLYLLAAWCFLLYVAFVFVVVLLLGVLAVYIAYRISSNSGGGSAMQNFERGKRFFFSPVPEVSSNSTKVDVTSLAGHKGSNIYSGTNWMNENLKGRVDEDGNIYCGTNWINENKVGRIDKEGNIFSGTNFFNETKVGRIDEDGNILKGTNWMNEEKTGRIDEDGNVYKGTNWFNEKKTGRSGD